MKIDLHTHTTASDGRMDPEKIISKAREVGLDGIAITDHNTMKGFEEAKTVVEETDFLLIPGIEVSSDHGHILVLGSESNPDTRDFEEVLEFAKENNALVIGAHPFAASRSGIEPEHLKKLDAVEVINNRGYPKGNKKAKEFAEENEMPKTVGSDTHLEEEIGSVWNEIEGKSVDEVLENIRKGENKIRGESPSSFSVTYRKIKTKLT